MFWQRFSIYKKKKKELKKELGRGVLRCDLFNTGNDGGSRLCGRRCGFFTHTHWAASVCRNLFLELLNFFNISRSMANPVLWSTKVRSCTVNVGRKNV